MPDVCCDPTEHKNLPRHNRNQGRPHDSLECYISRPAREWNHIPNVLDACCEHDQALKAQTKPSVRHTSISSQVQVCIINCYIHLLHSSLKDVKPATAAAGVKPQSVVVPLTITGIIPFLFGTKYRPIDDWHMQAHWRCQPMYIST
eukprot:GHUV01040616.1.p1 GENE.GHUV01040616.1~~GHUV01040616.1.p1  ORF type:complete len:146 (+),score=4.26 GHUV01040616.1:510-947(+)